jgi:hypothetical protein
LTGSTFQYYRDVVARDRRIGRLIAYALVAVSVALLPAPVTAFVHSILPGVDWLVAAGGVAVSILVLIGVAIEVVDKPAEPGPGEVRF